MTVQCKISYDMQPTSLQFNEFEIYAVVIRCIAKLMSLIAIACWKNWNRIYYGIPILSAEWSHYSQYSSIWWNETIFCNIWQWFKIHRRTDAKENLCSYSYSKFTKETFKSIKGQRIMQNWLEWLWREYMLKIRYLDFLWYNIIVMCNGSSIVLFVHIFHYVRSVCSSFCMEWFLHRFAVRYSVLV